MDETTVQLASGGPLPTLAEYRMSIWAAQIDEEFSVNDVKASPGDYLCKSSEGQFFTCGKVLFEAAYTLVYQGPKCVAKGCAFVARPDPYKMRKIFRREDGQLAPSDELVEVHLCEYHAKQMKL